MDMTIVFGLHKFSLQATIDHHEQSLYSGHYTTSVNCCKKILLQQQQNSLVSNDWFQKLPYYIMGVGLE